MDTRYCPAGGAAAISRLGRIGFGRAFGQPHHPRSDRPTSEPDDAGGIPVGQPVRRPGVGAHRGRSCEGCSQCGRQRSGREDRERHRRPNGDYRRGAAEAEEFCRARGNSFKPLEEFYQNLPLATTCHRRSCRHRDRRSRDVVLCQSAAQRSGRVHSASQKCSSLSTECDPKHSVCSPPYPTQSEAEKR